MTFSGWTQPPVQTPMQAPAQAPLQAPPQISTFASRLREGKTLLLIPLALLNPKGLARDDDEESVRTRRDTATGAGNSYIHSTETKPFKYISHTPYPRYSGGSLQALADSPAQLVPVRLDFDWEQF